MATSAFCPFGPNADCQNDAEENDAEEIATNKKPPSHNERRRGLLINLREVNQHVQQTGHRRSSVYPCGYWSTRHAMRVAFPRYGKCTNQRPSGAETRCFDASLLINPKEQGKTPLAE